MATTNKAAPAQPLAAEPDQPVSAAERLVTLDFIRGIAVLGIVFANITAFAQPFNAYFWPRAMTGGMEPGDGWVWVIQFVLVDGKFRGLFTLLFGAGVMLFMERAWARGANRWLQLRRLAWLLVFGLVHYFLIWSGDILTLYAVWGMVALLMVKWQARTQLGVGLSLYAFGTLVMTLLMGGSYLASTSELVQAKMTPAQVADVSEAPRRMLASAHEELLVMRDGTWPEIVADSVGDAPELLQEVLLVGPTETLGLMLIGMALYRFGLFSGALGAAAMRRWGWIGVIGGGVLSVPLALWPACGGFELFPTLLAFNGLAMWVHLPMVLGLAALLSLWAPTATTTWLGARFAAAGRMAFSNYLGTSIVMVAIFQGWGLGLFGRFHRPELVLFVLGAWVAMLAWSKWWLERYRYGPLEWLWRSLTYWKAFPLRR